MRKESNAGKVDGDGDGEEEGDDANDIPRRAEYGAGAYHRRIELWSEDEGCVRGELEDDFHHFGVGLRHAGGRVADVVGEDIRFPWTTCPAAMPAVGALVGQPLDASLLALARAVDVRAQCTHAFDLACLAVRFAARRVQGGSSQRSYDVVLPDRVAGRTTPTFDRDGERLLRWTVEGAMISESDPPLFAGRKLLGSGFNLFAERELDPELGEAALVFRRAIFIGMGRQYDFERIDRAQRFTRVVGSACHTFGPDQVDSAMRVHGSVRDFSRAATTMGRRGSGSRKREQ